MIAALSEYMQTHTDIPAPADLVKIIDPPKPRITEAEYVAAQKKHAANNFRRFTIEHCLIEDYEKQRDEEMVEWKRQQRRMEALA